MAYCPTIDSVTPGSSNFVFMLGLEPLQLYATIKASSPPETVTYKGQAGEFEMRVVSWKQTGSSMYAITAYNEPYFWKLHKITINMNEGDTGITIDELVTKIEGKLDSEWSISFDIPEAEGEEGEVTESDDDTAGYAFVDFSGSVLSALGFIEDLTGTFGYIDHKEKIIYFSKTIPTMATLTGEGNEDKYLMERSEGNTIDTEEIVLYGNFNRPPMSNKNAITTIGIDSYADTELYVDSNSWNADVEIELSSYTDELVSDTGYQEEETDPENEKFQYSKKTRVETYKRSFRPVVIAVTSSITQDEVADYLENEPAITTPDGEEMDTTEGEAVPKQNKTESKLVEVEYNPPEIDKGDSRLNVIRNLFEALKKKKIKVATVSDATVAETRVLRAKEAIKQDTRGVYTETTTSDTESTNTEGVFPLGSNPADTIYVLPFKNTAASGNARSRFSLNAYVVSSLPVREVTYHKITTQTTVNGQLEDVSPTTQDVPLLNMTTIDISNTYKIMLLNYLKFTWTFGDGAYRVKFPYAIDSGGNVYEPNEDIGDNIDEKTLVIQNNFVATPAQAKNKAKLLRRIANMDIEEGYLTNDSVPDLTKLSKYTEVFSSGAYKAMQYVRNVPSGYTENEEPEEPTPPPLPTW